MYFTKCWFGSAEVTLQLQHNENSAMMSSVVRNTVDNRRARMNLRDTVKLFPKPRTMILTLKSALFLLETKLLNTPIFPTISL